MRYNGAMETAIEAGTTESSTPAPRPKIDPTDALTLVPRLLAGFFMGGMAIFYVILGQWGMVAFLGGSSAILLYWAYRLIMKMRRENPEYIAYRTVVEAEERERKRVARS